METKLKLEYHSKKHNTLELKVRVLIDNTMCYCDDLQSFKRMFNNGLEKITQPNAFSADTSYKVKTINDNKIEIWHRKPTGETDRHICTIVETAICPECMQECDKEELNMFYGLCETCSEQDSEV